MSYAVDWCARVPVSTTKGQSYGCADWRRRYQPYCSSLPFIISLRPRSKMNACCDRREIDGQSLSDRLWSHEGDCKSLLWCSPFGIR